MFAFYVDLHDQEIDAIRRFNSDYKKLVVIGLNRNIKEYFNTELDSCMALDFHLDKKKNTRTDIGEMEYQAKYNRDKEAALKLTDHIINRIERLPRNIQIREL